MRSSIGKLILGCSALWGCGDSTVPSPFVSRDAGASADTSSASDADAGPVPVSDAGSELDPTLGGPCLDDGQCNDGLDCTDDSCDQSIRFCRYSPVASRCADSIYCDGEEVCDLKLGCREGQPLSCSDGLTCTIDRCIEEARTCEHAARDGDGDGDPVWNCEGGGDCNDTNPRVSSREREVCANGQDDDCDGAIDEPDGCATSQHDTCLDPLEIRGSGNYAISPLAAKSDYSATCAGSGGGFRDVVAALIVPPGSPIDVDITASSDQAQIALAAAKQCGDASSELDCAAGLSRPVGGTVSRLVLRALEPGNYPLYVFSTHDLAIALKVEFRPATPKPANETCGTAAAISPGVHVKVPIVDADRDHPSACATSLGELLYTFTLAAPQDVHVYAASLDGLGAPMISLRAPGCTSADDELTCQLRTAPDLFARALPAGSYFVAVSATAPTDVDLLLELSPASVPPADESCVNSPLLVPNRSVQISLAAHQDDLHLDCLIGAPDAAYRLDLPGVSDVLLVQRFPDFDTGGVALARPPCGSAADKLICGTASRTPARAALRNVPAGSYRAVVESERAGSVELLPLVRPAAPAILVAFSDSCADALTIPAAGAFLQGNTANSKADHDAGCDLGGQPAGGAPDQMLRLVLNATKRVVLDMKGSNYTTLLDVRRGPDCPGDELVRACAAGYVQDKSYLDLTLTAGEYWVQVDGYAGAKGAWQLDVHVVDP